MEREGDLILTPVVGVSTPEGGERGRGKYCVGCESLRGRREGEGGEREGGRVLWVL